jgi:proliferating cell nuclear antigen
MKSIVKGVRPPDSAEVMEGRVLEITTVQTAPFRTLATALKDILLETNIIFTPEGIKIMNMDKTQTILVHLLLDAENFETFECAHPKITIGVNTLHFFRLINTMDNDDTLTLFINEEDYSDGVVDNLGLKFENGSIGQCKTHKLKLIEPDPEESIMPEVEFSSVISLPASDFQKIVRDMATISDRVAVQSVGKELIFSCKGSYAEATIRRSEMEDGSTTFKENDGHVVHGEFSLRNLSYFIKCTNLCPSIEMMLENDLPLVVMYNVASLGTIRLCLTPLPPKED